MIKVVKAGKFLGGFLRGIGVGPLDSHDWDQPEHFHRKTTARGRPRWAVTSWDPQSVADFFGRGGGWNTT